MSLDFLTVDQDVKTEPEKDTLGGRRALKSDVYPVTIKVAYFDKSKSGANSLTIVAETKDGDKFTHTEWLTNREGKNFYKDKKSGEKKILSGFLKMNSLTKLLIGKELAASAIEEKHVKIYDFDAKEEVAKPRNVIIDLNGVDAVFAIREVLETKMAKDDQGKYTIPTAETHQSNDLEKVFNTDNKTLAEVDSGSDAAFINEWSEAYKGQVKDKTVKGAAKAGAPGVTKSSAPALDLN